MLRDLIPIRMTALPQIRPFNSRELTSRVETSHGSISGKLGRSRRGSVTYRALHALVYDP